MFNRIINFIISHLSGTCSCGASFQGTPDPMNELCGPCYRGTR